MEKWQPKISTTRSKIIYVELMSDRSGWQHGLVYFTFKELSYEGKGVSIRYKDVHNIWSVKQ